MPHCDDPTGEVDAYQMDLLEKLIAFQSVNPPGRETPAAEFLARELRSLGFEVETPEVLPGRSNVVARLHSGDGPEIVLSGHLDVVAAVPEQWSRNPFSLWEDGGRLYGRGTSDMKGAIAAMVAAARDIVAEKGQLGGTLTLLFVADEEDGTAGTLHYVASRARPDLVIIGEPTGMNVAVAHRGVARYHVDIAGQSGHASLPEQAKNPITLAARLIEAVDRRNRELSALTHSILPPPTIAVTMVEAAEQPNTIPGRCRLTIDRRTHPGEQKEDVENELQAMWQNAAPDDKAALGKAVFSVFTRAGQTLPGSTFAEDCRSALARIGVEARIGDFPAGCDQFAFTGAGIDCVLIGPGHIAQAHTVDEFVDKSQLGLARRFYREFIKERLQCKTI